ncbi:hypothetical protein FOZ63_005267 [Perkinsus olseni]|uniref:Uncharacterized protein n=1 Tax=Perkinsus olseni TaxID=32597 RepID=A0A7J6SQE4_PEROL|nr:hypothetical protein FOZ63_005267 [Perkinsus olseni]
MTAGDTLTDTAVPYEQHVVGGGRGGKEPSDEEAHSVRGHHAPTSMFTARRSNSFDSTVAGASTTSSSDSSSEDSSDVISGHYINKEDTLIIFDWDDTILPTRYLTVQWGLRVDGPSPPTGLMSALDDYAMLVKDTLLTAMEFGTVIIVTNAEAGWIPLTCAKFLPSLLPTLSNIHHISARTAYEPQRSSGRISPSSKQSLSISRALQLQAVAAVWCLWAIRLTNVWPSSTLAMSSMSWQQFKDVIRVVTFSVRV